MEILLYVVLNGGLDTHDIVHASFLKKDASFLHQKSADHLTGLSQIGVVEKIRG